MLKLSRSGGETGESEKVFLILESGIRFHTTKFAREKSDTPSNFTLKLRKHIRTKRIEFIKQMGVDRVVDIQFGAGEVAHHLILELFAHGNIVLTDANYHVLTLLRSHRDDDKGVAIMANRPYPLNLVRRFVPLERSAFREFFEARKENGSGETNGKKTRLKDKLSKLVPYGPTVCEHCLVEAGLSTGAVLSSTEALSEGQLESLFRAIKSFEDWLHDIKINSPRGYILTKSQKGSKPINDDFCPLLFAQYREKDHVDFDLFDTCLDDYFSTIESQKSDIANAQIKSQAMSKLTKVKKDHSDRVGNLSREASTAEKKAQMIEYCLDDVDAAIKAVNDVLKAGMPWAEIKMLIKEEQAAGNPVAALIHSLQLEKNQVTLILSNTLDDADEEEMARPAEKVEVDLSMNAHANATAFYGNKKARVAKQEKTLASSGKALQAAEEKAKEHLASAKRTASIQLMRKVHWFEKFNWFITSENFLVLSGRDAQQNELLVKRYLRKGDLYLHADLHGASTCIIKNPRSSEDLEVPPLSLSQAGTFCICRSQAWDAKVVTSAWWVYHHQVSKTAPTGEYLTTGSFMIRGKKNYLPPTPLVMGFGFLFRLDEQSVANHIGERQVRGTEAFLKSADMIDGMETEVHEAPNTADKEISLDHRPKEELTEPTTRNVSEDPTEVNVNDSYESEDTCDRSSVKEDLQSDSNGQHQYAQHGNGETNNSSARRRLTAKERRLLKKGKLQMTPDGQLIGDGDTLDSLDYSNQQKAADTEGSDVKVENGTREKQVRGKKGKLKKLKDKYAEQDEEERKIAMEILQPQGKKEDAENTKKESVESDAAPRGPVPEEVRNQLQHLGFEDPLHYETRAQRKARVRKEKEEEKAEVEAILVEENVKLLDAEEKERMTEIDTLTSCPKAEDVLLYCIPFCGPYSSMTTFKFKVKLTPGSQKKGKAAKLARDVLMRTVEATPREKELMRAVTDPELVQGMIGNVQLSMPGLQKLKQSAKQSKKSKKSGK